MSKQPDYDYDKRNMYISVVIPREGDILLRKFLNSIIQFTTENKNLVLFLTKLFLMIYVTQITVTVIYKKNKKYHLMPYSPATPSRLYSKRIKMFITIMACNLSILFQCVRQTHSNSTKIFTNI